MKVVAIAPSQIICSRFSGPTIGVESFTGSFGSPAPRRAGLPQTKTISPSSMPTPAAPKP